MNEEPKEPMSDAVLDGLMHNLSTEQAVETSSPEALDALPEPVLGPLELQAIRALTVAIRAAREWGAGVTVAASVSPALYQALLDKERQMRREFMGLAEIDLKMGPNCLEYRGAKIRPDLRMKRLNYDVLARLRRLDDDQAGPRGPKEAKP